MTSTPNSVIHNHTQCKDYFEANGHMHKHLQLNKKLLIITASFLQCVNPWNTIQSWKRSPYLTSHEHIELLIPIFELCNSLFLILRFGCVKAPCADCVGLLKDEHKCCIYVDFINDNMVCTDLILTCRSFACMTCHLIKKKAWLMLSLRLFILKPIKLKQNFPVLLVFPLIQVAAQCNEKLAVDDHSLNLIIILSIHLHD